MKAPQETLLSVVIPSYMAADNLPKTLSALGAQVSDNSVEVIVVDCSPDESVAEVCNEYSFVRLIRCKERFNPGGGRNIGAKESVGKYLVFLDSDVVLDKSALSAISYWAEKSFKVFGGALELSEERANFSSYIEHYYFNHESQSHRPRTQRSNLSSALMIIEKELFMSVGGFSDIPRMQDTELTERLVKQGHSLDFFPNVIGYQVQDSPLSKVMRKIYITGNNLYFLRYAQRSNVFKCALLLALPILMLIKATRINWRHLMYSKSKGKLMLLMPVMYVCGSAWMLGFYKGMLSGNGIAKGR